MNHKALLDRIEGSTRLDPADIPQATPKRAVDHLVLAATAFLADDFETANAHVETALHQRPEMVTAPYMTARVFRHLPPDRFTAPGLHPWFGLQWMMQPQQNLDTDRLEHLGRHLLDTGFDTPSCYLRIFEQVCEARLRPSSLGNPATADWLRGFLDRHGAQAPEAAVFYRACLDHAAGDRASAAEGFRRFAGSDHPTSHAMRGASSYLDAPGAQAFTPKGMRVLARAQGTPIVFTADPIYFAQWSPLLLACLARAQASVGVHFHIVGDPDAGLATLADLPAGLTGRVGLSVEDDPGLGKAYFASARFISARHLLEAYGQPLLFSDIDTAFDPVAGDLMARLTDHPAAFLFKDSDNHFPWRSVTANLCYLSDDPRCHAMLDLMARYLGTVFDAPEDTRSLWWCDQNALAYAVAESGLDRTAASFFRLRRTHGGLPFRFAPNSSDKKDQFRATEMERIA